METGPEAIINRVMERSTEIMALCQNVPDAALGEPILPNGWSMKDTVAHLAAWVWRCVGLLEAAPQSNGPLKAQPDVEGLNHEFHQEHQGWDWAEVEADFRRAHSALCRAIRQLPPERLEEPLVQETIARETWAHYAEHLPDLKQDYEQVRQMLVV